MLTATSADIALLNSGTLRSDRVHPKGEFRIRDLLSILPFPDLLVVIEVSGWLSSCIGKALLLSLQGKMLQCTMREED